MLPFTRPTLGEDEIQAVREVLESGWITSGPKVQQFEQALADYVGGGVQVRAFNSATGALEACLLAGGIGPGDEVIVPAMSFVATANVVVRAGARPVFVDVELRSRNVTPEAVAKAITPRTRAVIPVHFSGLAVDMPPLYELARKHDLLIVEDAAHAIGTEVGGRKVGAFGNPVCFSFHPNKNMTTIEGGAVASGDPAFVKRLEAIRFHGREPDGHGGVDVKEWGGKMNLPDVNAVIGLIQLRRLDGFNAKRRQLVERYFELMPRHPALVLPATGEGHTWHMFVVCLDFAALGTTRAAVQAALEQQDIRVGYHYEAMHLFSLYRGYGYGPGDFPVAERIGRETLTLPLFPGMEEADVDRVCNALGAILASPPPPGAETP
ncbi:MAG TPA: DegT/DnrJ/EryC1/StrS aminotransferase family protein [bacterium]|nr:DegT/DnrJ/EryC1/StrS aminotransferase family protein [bacterium]